jgi:hypothetical protein
MPRQRSASSPSMATRFALFVESFASRDMTRRSVGGVKAPKPSNETKRRGDGLAEGDLEPRGRTMNRGFLKSIFGRLDEDPGVSRRDILAGLGLAGALLAAPKLFASPAEAMPLENAAEAAASARSSETEATETRPAEEGADLAAAEPSELSDLSSQYRRRRRRRYWRRRYWRRRYWRPRVYRRRYWRRRWRRRYW